MVIIHLFLALAGAAAILAASSNVTIPINAIPGNTSITSNLISSEKDSVNLASTHAFLGNITTTSNLTSEKDVANTAATPGRCGIHVRQYMCNDKSKSNISMVFKYQDWKNNVASGGIFPNSVVYLPLIGLGDWLLSELDGDELYFRRHGTISKDEWKITDARCTIGAVDEVQCTRDTDCGFACDPLKFGS
ncbi:MAG: hypothetical protein Q9175_004631 [Cornicularia normoerica]